LIPGEEKRRGMGKQIRDLEAELDEERKQKVSALNSKKKLEADFKDLESTMEMNNKMKEDALKQLKKLQVMLIILSSLRDRKNRPYLCLQVAIKDVTRDAEEAHLAKTEAQQQFKDLEKKIKTLEADMLRLQVRKNSTLVIFQYILESFQYYFQKNFRRRTSVLLSDNAVPLKRNVMT